MDKWKKDLFENKCDRCGTLQTPSKKIGDFTVYECKQQCKCGGMFITFYDGKPMETGSVKRIHIGG